jgi:hypothetical protein
LSGEVPMSNPAAMAAEHHDESRRRVDWPRAVRLVGIVLGFALVAMLAARTLAGVRAADEAAEEVPRIRAPDAPRMPLAPPPQQRATTKPLPPLPPIPGPVPGRAVSSSGIPVKPMLVRR